MYSLKEFGIVGHAGRAAFEKQSSVVWPKQLDLINIIFLNNF